jgi:mannose-6-phosphate isomerase-like protein (cupin superfamily)
MYKVAKLKDFTTIKRSPQFIVQITEDVDEKFSTNYLRFINGRDPVEENKVCMINDGYSALYIVTEGELTFTFFENGKSENVLLKNKERVYITAKTKYEITGKGELLTICLPAYKEEMYSFPQKPQI